jgi:hypothetical protein
VLSGDIGNAAAGSIEVADAMLTIARAAKHFMRR